MINKRDMLPCHVSELTRRTRFDFFPLFFSFVRNMFPLQLYIYCESGLISFSIIFSMSNAIEILDSKPVPQTHADYAPARSPSSMAFATWATDIVQTFFSSDAYARTKGVLEFSRSVCWRLRISCVFANNTYI